jgi:hypothetical protein
MNGPADYDVPEYLLRHTNRLCQNLARVDSLLNLHDFASEIIQKRLAADPEIDNTRFPDVGDILRSVTVLLHACLEDFLRTIAQAHMPRTASDLLENIPLVGTGNSHLTKFTLSDLAKHSGKDVVTVIDESILEWLGQRSFSSANDIAAILKHIGIDPRKCNSEFPAISTMIKRCHAIVHNADRPKDSIAHDAEVVSPITRDDVTTWREAVQKFTTATLHQLQFLPHETNPM